MVSVGMRSSETYVAFLGLQKIRQVRLRLAIVFAAVILIDKTNSHSHV